MNKKISLPELIDIVAKVSNYKRKEVELFLTDLFELIEERIYQDGIVKIKGLGIFKLIPVEERKSINVNTGADIIIAAHQKVSFTPDPELKATVGESIADPEPIHEYAIPVVEYVEQDNENEDNSTQTEYLSEVVEPSDDTADLIIDSEHKSEAIQKEQKPIVSLPDAKHHAFLAEEVERLKKQLNEAQTLLHIPNKKPSFWWGLFAGIFFMISVGYICWYAGWFNLIPDPVSVENMHEPRGLESADPAISDDELQRINQPVSTDLDKVTFTSGMTLFKLSTKYYGHRIFWVYLFDANKERLTSPNNIKIGTEIVIPKLDSALIDSNNLDAMSKAQKLQSDYYLKYNLGR